MKTIYRDRYQQMIDILIAERKRAKLTQIEVAQKLNKPQSYIAKIEGRDRKIDILEFIELCETLGIKASSLIKQIE
ncbi:XRE family transcriptional regulator [Acinetobacter guerrae]|uniref:XRE family transcriptional regulator n=1 Tax=Acinetobacter guerrae TaxID=1843371 RepID=A0A3A8EPQ0_9GAMM|nr:helix-turn-helix transcriptional regulator [Acinetobacter guerrae]RKG35476.1 XRE family transcriptional regulator [Acinetobacter guerrae]